MGHYKFTNYEKKYNINSKIQKMLEIEHVNTHLCIFLS